MKNKILLVQGLALMSAALLLTGCAQFSGFQTARTVDQGGGEIHLAAGGLGTQINFDVDTFINENITATVPFLEVGGRWGLGEKVDMGLRLSTTLNMTLDARYQFVGDKSSVFAMAIGGGIGYQGGIGPFNLFQTQVPLYMSVHPADNVGIYLTPRFAAQFATSSGGGSVNWGGFSTGVELGRNIRFGADLSYFRIINNQEIFQALNFFQIGVGMKFMLGAATR